VSDITITGYMGMRKLAVACVTETLEHVLMKFPATGTASVAVQG
jgi:hypothetical protein